MTGGCAWRTQSFFSCSAQKRNAVRMHGYKLRIVWRCGRQAGGEACCCAAQLSVTDSKSQSSLRVSARFTSAATKRFKSAGFIQTGGFGICFLITVLLPSSASVPWSFLISFFHQRAKWGFCGAERTAPQPRVKGRCCNRGKCNL